MAAGAGARAVKDAVEEQSTEKLLELSRSSKPAVRLAALRSMCPCKVKDDFAGLWKRIFEVSR